MTVNGGELWPRRRSASVCGNADEVGRLWLMWLVGPGIRRCCPRPGPRPPSISVCSPNKLSTRFPISSKSSVQTFCKPLPFLIRLDKPVARSSKLSSAGESEDKTAVMDDFVAKEDCNRVLEISSACTLRANKESR